MAFGYLDSQNIDFATGQTESRLRNMQNRLGINFVEFINRVDGAVSAVNDRSGLVADLTYLTSEDRKIGPYGASKVFQQSAEYSPPRPQKGSGSGWLLPLYENDIALGFTKKALDVMQIAQFEGELSTTVQAIQRGQRADVLTRLFSDAEEDLDNDGVGATPGFAGSGTGSNVYGGPTPPGVSTLNLYQRVASAGEIHLSRCQASWVTMLKVSPATPSGTSRAVATSCCTTTHGKTAMPMPVNAHCLIASTL